MDQHKKSWELACRFLSVRCLSGWQFCYGRVATFPIQSLHFVYSHHFAIIESSPFLFFSQRFSSVTRRAWNYNEEASLKKAIICRNRRMFCRFVFLPNDRWFMREVDLVHGSNTPYDLDPKVCSVGAFFPFSAVTRWKAQQRVSSKWRGRMHIDD